MTALAVTNTFVDGNTILASGHNTNFSDIVTYVNNRNDGTATWDALRVTTSSAVVAIFNNSTGTSDILRCNDNGTTVFLVSDGGGVVVTATGTTNDALVVNNGTSTGDILELRDNGTSVMRVVDGGTCIISIPSGTAKGITVDSGTSTGNILELTDNTFVVMSVADGGTCNIAANGGTNKALRVNNGSSTGNILELLDDNVTVFFMSDGGNSVFTNNHGTNDTLVINNNSSTGDILELQDGGNATHLFKDGGEVVFNEQGLSTGHVRMESDNSANLFYLDATNDRIVLGGTAAAAGCFTYTRAAGVQLGAPTGGDKGASTMNVAADIYKNNTAYANPDYALEYWATGKIEKFKNNDGAKDYKGILPIDDLIEYCKKNFDLPRVKSLGADETGGQGIFSRADVVLEKIEEAYLYIFELHERLKKVEKVN